MLTRNTQQRGLREAEVPVVLQDGARWLWQHLAPLAGEGRVEIIDFYHTARYVKDALEVLVSDPVAREFWKEVLLTCLKDGKRYLVSDTLRDLLADSGPLLDPVQDACDYIRHQGYRMHYADYQGARLQITSGTIESRVRQVASDRLKQAGMRWNPDHAEAVAQVRAAILSEQSRWDAFWQSYVPPARTYQSHAQAA